MVLDNSFTGILGNSPRVKLLEFLLLSRGGSDYHLSDLARGSDISRPSCYKELKELKKRKLIIMAGKYKNQQLYRLNNESSIVKGLLKTLHSALYYKK